MTDNHSAISADRFGLTRFSELLSLPGPLLGEDWEAREGFRDGILTDLNPQTPYECVIAENIVEIEWELIQRVEMRRACLQETIIRMLSGLIFDAFMLRKREEWAVRNPDSVHLNTSDQAWLDRFHIDEVEQRTAAISLARQLSSSEPPERENASARISGLGVSIELARSNAYASVDGLAANHNEAITKLEKR